MKKFTPTDNKYGFININCGGMQRMRVKKMQNPNNGIKCVVNTCYYYMDGDHCTAEKIEVQPRNAANSDQTDCATFIKDG
jgi:hypothetical protein